MGARLAPPAFTGGRGLKHVETDSASAAARTARLHRRARIETSRSRAARRPSPAPPAFTGGRGLKLQQFAVAHWPLPHRPPSPAGAD